MHHRARGMGLSRAAVLAAVVLAAVVLAACGGSGSPAASTSASASQVLNATFTGSHKITSGTLDVELTATPTGSSTFATPVTLSFSGPFDASGTGKIGNADFTLNVRALNTSLVSLGLESLHGKGYISLGGTSYRLPARDYRQLEASLSHTASGSTTNTGILQSLGIDPLHWLSDPTMAGSASVGGVPTTHIRAKLNVGVLIDDFGALLGKASSLGVPNARKLPLSISPATKAKIVAEIRNPRVDIWTGAADKTLRKLTVNMTLPVTGTISRQLGGLKSAALSLVVLYQNLGQPQTISPPTSVKPFSRFRSQAKSLLGTLRGAVPGG